MIKRCYILFTVLVFGLFFNAKATHNRAGEITYTWLYGYTYKIKVTTYTRIGMPNVADRCYDTLYFGDGVSAIVPRSNGTTTSLCGNGSGPPFDGVPITPIIKMNEYEITHTYPGPGQYTMSTTDPNRNAGIVNLPNSVNQVFCIESFLMITTFQGPNNSPIPTFAPIDDGIVGQCFYHNPGAYDIDGDSLSYELTYCRGINGQVCPGYTYPNFGTGGMFSLDSLTGTLSWCTPQLQGEYNMAMYIKEWRKNGSGIYQLIGYIIRDMQVTIGNSNNNMPFITLNSNTDTTLVAGTPITFALSANDVDGNIATLEAHGGSFNFGAQSSAFTSTLNSVNITASYNWNTFYNHVRYMPYQITLKVKDQDSQVSLANFKTFNVKVIPEAPTNLITTNANEFIRLNWKKPASYTTSNNSFLRYRIYRKTGFSSWIHSNKETVPPLYTGFNFIGFTNSTITDTVFFDFNNGVTFPVGQLYTYVVVAEYTDGSTSYVSNNSTNQIFVGINETNAFDLAIKLYPNPLTDNLTITFTEEYNTKALSIDLLDVTGRKIKTFLNNEKLPNQNAYHLNLENIGLGIYFIKISIDQQTITKKIIKQ